MVSRSRSCWHLLLVWLLMTQHSASLQNFAIHRDTTRTIITSEASIANRFVTEFGDQEAHATNTLEARRRRRTGLDGINFGGPAHSELANGKKLRPEAIKSLSCGAEACTECTDPSTCWHGNGVKAMRLAVSPSNAHSRFLMDLWARCGTGGGQWVVGLRTGNYFANGHLAVYADGVLVDTITEAQVHAAAKKQLRVRVPVNQDSHVRIEFVRTDPSQSASAFVEISASRVDAQVDDCMAIKDCLAKLGDGSEDDFALRNSNKAQLRCIEAPDPAAISTTCGQWKKCLVAQKKTYEIKAFLRAAVGSDVPSVIQARLGDMAAMTEEEKEEECVDPSVADAESWECDCLEQMKVTCAGLNKALEDCLPGLLCSNENVCQTWKQTHCPAALMRTWNSSMELLVTKSRAAATQNKIADSLDNALGGKCAV